MLMLILYLSKHDCIIFSDSYSSFIVGCSVWKTSTQSYSINDIIRYDGIAVNRGNHFNQITSQFVCPTNAVYHVTATAKKSSTSDLQVNRLCGVSNVLFAASNNESTSF